MFYLDLSPNLINLPGGRTELRTAMRSLGPVNCFKQDHLYTLYFGQDADDIIERKFFGAIDQIGEKAVPFFADYQYCEEAHRAFPGMRNYLAAQLFRTPRGLHLLQRLARTVDHQTTLLAMEKLWQLYQTIWSEAVWEVFNCRSSPTKFIITDAPVTTYNREVFPGSQEVQCYGIAKFERIGTRVLFPIDRDHCLCVTNLQYVRNPKVSPLKVRENPRYFGQGLFDLRKIQRGREIDEDEVLAINHVLKSNATRYIAAPVEEWLYPEKRLKQKFGVSLVGSISCVQTRAKSHLPPRFLQAAIKGLLSVPMSTDITTSTTLAQTSYVTLSGRHFRLPNGLGMKETDALSGNLPK
jgi:hypothetical protein